MEQWQRLAQRYGRDYSWLGREDTFETIMNLINGKRLKDISDLPLDLSI